MFNPKKTKLATTMAVALAAGSAGTQAAVQLATEGVGDAAIIPYYSVRGTDSVAPWRTFIRIFNTSLNAVAVKVRFREAENSREVLDFIVWLSPRDAWTGWLDPNADGAGNPGIRTDDVSCTTPARANDNWPPLNPQPVGQPANRPVVYETFKADAFQGVYDDGGTDGLERTKEGHVEIIGVAQWAPGTLMANNVTHPPGGTAPSCINTEFFNLGETPPAAALATAQDVDNVLTVNAYLVRTETGQSVGVPVTMLANFAMPITQLNSPTQADVVAASNVVANRLIGEVVSDAQKPDLDSADPFSIVTNLGRQTFNSFPGQITFNPANPLNNLFYLSAWNEFATQINGFVADTPNLLAPIVGGELRAASRRSLTTDANGVLVTPAASGIPSVNEPGWVYPWIRGGVDAVSAVLTRREVVNEWGRRSDQTKAVKEIATQWVLTFPTKHYYVDIQKDEAIPTYSPFNIDNIYPTLMDFGIVGPSPEPVAFDPFAERFQFTGVACNRFSIRLFDYEEQFATFTSPVPSVTPGLCYETNVIGFGNQTDSSGLDVGLPTKVGFNIPATSFPSTKATEGWAVMDLGTSISAGGFAPHTGSQAPGGVNRGLRGYRVNPRSGVIQGNTVYWGLPVVGFQVTNFQIGANADNFANAHDHAYTRHIEVSTVVPPVVLTTLPVDRN